MRFFIPALLFLFFFHPSASSASELFGSLKVAYNEKIEEQVRTKIQDLNKEIIQSFKADQPTVMFYKLSENLRENGFDPIEKLYAQSAKIISKKTFSPSHDFLVLHSGSGEKTSPVVSPTSPVFLTYVTLTAGVPKYVSIMESKGEPKDLAAVFIYEQIGADWFLNTFQIGTIRIGGKTAVDWFNEAKLIHQKGHMLPAFLRLAVAQQFLRPVSFIHYKIENEIKELASQCRTELEKHSYPIPLDTDPITKLINIAPRYYKGEIIPAAKYLSLIPLTDEDKIKAEAKKMVPKLEALFPGFSLQSKNVAFQVVSELPSNSQQKPPSFDLVVPVK